jgi:hypothetical protein
MCSQSGSATVPPSSLVPRQFQTPAMAMQQRPTAAALSAFRAPSVTISGRLGLPSSGRTAGGTSSAMRALLGVSYLMGRPSALRRGSSGRIWCSITSPVTPWTGTTSAGTRC